MTLGNYLHQLEEVTPASKQPEDSGVEAIGSRIISLSIAMLAKNRPGAAAVLKLASFLGTTSIPLEVILATHVSLPDLIRDVVGSTEKFNEEVACLLRLALVRRCGSSLDIHQLTQLTMRRALTIEERRVWSLAALIIIDSALPSISSESFNESIQSAYERLAPHGFAAAVHAEEADVGAELRLRVLNDIGLYAWMRGDLGRARNCYERALKAGETTDLGPEVSTVWSNLGRLHVDAGELAGATSAFNHAIHINELAFGSDHPLVARDVNNIGGVFSRLGDIGGARRAFERALSIDERALGSEHPEVAIDLNNLGTVLYDAGVLSDAKVAFQRALAIDEKAFGNDHPNVGLRSYALGVVLAAEGDLATARDLLSRSLEISCIHFGEQHPHTVLVRKAIAGLRRRSMKAV